MPLRSPASTSIPPQPTADGVYLVNHNSSNGGLSGSGSGFAYYKNIRPGQNVGQQPDDYAVETTDTYAQWENARREGFYRNSNVTFTAHVNVGAEEAASLPVNAVVGNASNSGLSGEIFRTFILYKDNGTLLYEADGSRYYSYYYAG